MNFENTTLELAKLKKRARTASRFEGNNDVTRIIKANIATYEKHLQSGDESALKQAKKTLLHNAAVVEEILDEYDYIKKLLDGRSKATDEQVDALLFPKDSGSKSNVLQVSGQAGTGKTLVLLARIAYELRKNDPSDKMEGHEFGPKRALFVCFNKTLVDYVQSIFLKLFPELAASITVINIDRMVKRIMDEKHSSESPCPGIIYGKKDLKEIVDVAAKRHAKESLGFLNTEDPKNIDWVKEEIDWIEGRKDIEFGGDIHKYQEFGRIGRGRFPYGPAKNSNARAVILEIMQEYYKQNEEHKKYTYPQAVNELLKDAGEMGYEFDKSEFGEEKQMETARYDIIVIDEVQDFSVASIMLLLTFRKKGAKVVLAGDEGQKIYKRDFKWKQLSDGNNPRIGQIIGHTVSLDKNHRNHPEIERFAARLKGGKDDMPFDADVVELAQKNIEQVVEKARLLGKKGGTTCLITDTPVDAQTWREILVNADITPTRIYRNGEITAPGIYVANVHQVKGVEFDNVIIPDTKMVFDDEEACKNLYYVAFTRARRFLGVYFSVDPDAVIRRHYGDLL
jgi:superfamily I DNA/RNA helicase